MSAPAPNAPANSGPGATALADVDAWMRGDSSIVFLMKITAREVGVGAKVLCAHVGKRNVNISGSTPALILPGLSISIVNDAFGSYSAEESRILFEQFRAGQLQYGGFELSNVDGRLDSWLNYSFADAQALLQVGRNTYSLAQFKTIMPMMIVADPTFSLRGTIKFQVKGSAGLNLNRRVLSTEFAGSGGLEGGSDLEGKLKPLLLGKKDNIKPVLVDAATLQYLIDPDGVASIGSVYEGGQDGGAGVTKDAANGAFTLHAEPTGEVTCDAVGKDRRAPGGGVQNELWNLFDSAVQDFGGGSAISRAGMAYDGGEYLDVDSAMTFEELLTRLTRPSGVFYPAQDDSALHVAELTGGSPTSVRTYNRKHVESIEKISTAPPIASFRVAYRVLGHLLSSILPGVSDVERARLSQQYRHKTSTLASVLDDYANALSVESVSALYDAADATSTSSAMRTWLDSRNALYRVKLLRHPFAAWLCQLVTIDFPAFDFDGGKNVMVVGYEVALASRSVNMIVFGEQATS